MCLPLGEAASRPSIQVSKVPWSPRATARTSALTMYKAPRADQISPTALDGKAWPEIVFLPSFLPLPAWIGSESFCGRTLNLELDPAVVRPRSRRNGPEPDHFVQRHSTPRQPRPRSWVCASYLVHRIELPTSLFRQPGICIFQVGIFHSGEAVAIPSTSLRMSRFIKQLEVAINRNASRADKVV